MSLANSTDDSDVRAVLEIVDWDAIAQRVRGICKVSSSTWGQHTRGASNIVRFLHLHGLESVAVRIPFDPAKVSVDDVVASISYIAQHTTIPVPRIIYHTSSSAEAGTPFIVMSRAEGVALCYVWEEMGDSARFAVLEQVADILVQMSQQRFDSIGKLASRLNTDGHPEWYIKPRPGTGKVFHSGVMHMITQISESLDNIVRDAQYDDSHLYAQTWWLRSLVPAIWDDSLDATGFPLSHGDFEYQNIFIVGAETDHPRVSCIIDWDDTGTESSSDFSSPPFFFVDNPFADPHDERTKRLSARNARDRAVFIRMLEQAEEARGVSPRLAPVFDRSQGVYLIDQCIQSSTHMALMYPRLVQLVVGLDDDAHFTWICQLLDEGILKPVRDEFIRKFGEYKPPHFELDGAKPE